VHTTARHCTALEDHVTLYFNNNMSTTAVFFEIEKKFDTILHSGLLYKLSELEQSTCLIMLSAPFLANRKFEVLVEDEFSTSRETAAGCLKVSSCPCTLQLHINDAPPPPWHLNHLALFADDTAIYETYARNINFLFWSEFVVWALEHNDQWKENSGIYLKKT
jgi:hypothetical protein